MIAFRVRLLTRFYSDHIIYAETPRDAEFKAEHLDLIETAAQYDSDVEHTSIVTCVKPCERDG